MLLLVYQQSACDAGTAVLDTHSFEAAVKQEVLLSAGEQHCMIDMLSL